MLATDVPHTTFHFGQRKLKLARLSAGFLKDGGARAGTYVVRVVAMLIYVHGCHKGQRAQRHSLQGRVTLGPTEQDAGEIADISFARTCLSVYTTVDYLEAGGDVLVPLIRDAAADGGAP